MQKEAVTLLKDAFELKRQEKYKKAMELLYKALSVCPDNVEILLQVAEVHMLLKNAASACNILEQIMAKEPSNVTVFGILIDYYVTCFNYEKAKVALAKFLLAYPSEKAYEILLKNNVAMKDYPAVIEFYETKSLKDLNSDCINKYYAIALSYENRLEDAKSLFEELVKNNYADEEISYNYARTLYQLGFETEAGKIVMGLIPGAVMPEVYNLAGELEINKGKFESAISLLSTSVKKKQDGLYLYNLATAYFLNGQLKEAQHFYTKAIATSSQTMEYRYALAYLYYKQSNLIKAKQVLSFILDCVPTYKEALLLRSQILFDENHFLQAQETLNSIDAEQAKDDKDFLLLAYKTAVALYKSEKAYSYITALVEKFPEVVEYTLELARFYYNHAQYSKSLQTAENVLLQYPACSGAYVIAAQNYLAQDDYEKADFMAEKAARADLNNTEVLYVKAKICEKTKQYDCAIEIMKTLLEYSPNEAKYYVFMASLYATKEQIESAIEYYKEAVSIDANVAEYFVKIAELYNSLENTSETIRYLYIAYTLNPGSTDIILGLANAYVKAGRYKNALRFLKDILSKTEDADKEAEIREKYSVVDALFKKEVSFLVYQIWHLLGI